MIKKMLHKRLYLNLFECIIKITDELLPMGDGPCSCDVLYWIITRRGQIRSGFGYVTKEKIKYKKLLLNSE